MANEQSRQMADQTGARAARLSSDGELPDLESLLESASDSAPETHTYCIHCGTANPNNASYCARCGQPLIDADAFNVGREKGKRSDPRAESRVQTNVSFPMVRVQHGKADKWTVWSVGSVMVRLACLAGMIFSTLFSEYRGLLWAPLLAGFLVEAVRNDKRDSESLGSAGVEMITSGLVTGIYIALLFTSHGDPSSWPMLLVLLFWFLVEAVRS